MTQLFASTTFQGTERTRITDAVASMRNTTFDGLELGSTHRYEDESSLLHVRDSWPRRILTHNFFPPSADEAFILNIAAIDRDVRSKSVQHCRYCIDIAARLGAELYTVHPGFMAAPLQAVTKRGSSYFDFFFDESRIPHEAAFQAMLEGLGTLLDHARSMGVTLAIESEGSITKQGILLMERPDEYNRLFAALPGLRLNFNLAHTTLSAQVHGFDVAEFIEKFGSQFAAVELSHNDGHSDQHAPLVSDSYVLSWLDQLPDVPWILEFRNASVNDLENSAALIRAAQSE